MCTENNKDGRPGGEPVILYHDSDIAVCVKPAGVLSEGEMPALLSRELGTEDIYAVHRLDRDTAGVMVYALTRRAAASLSPQFSQDGGAHKTYLAVIEGVMEPQQGVLKDLLFHDASKNRSYVVDRMRKGVREAELSYRTLSSLDGRSLVEISLHSGRTHQIRVQFSSRRHPVAGDRRYGSRTSGGMALWAYSLTFSHPSLGTEMTFSFLPPRFGLWGPLMSKAGLSEQDTSLDL